MDISNDLEKNRVRQFLVGLSCITKLVKPSGDKLDISELGMEERLRQLYACPYSIINRISEDIVAKNAEVAMAFVESHKTKCAKCDTDLVSILKFLDRSFFVQ